MHLQTQAHLSGGGTSTSTSANTSSSILGMVAAVALPAVLSLPFALTLSAPPPRAGEAVLAVFSPLAPPATAVQAVARADGVVVAGTTVAWIVVASSDRADFVRRLEGEGAILVRGASGDWACNGDNQVRGRPR
jgi:hypothetical protein